MLIDCKIEIYLGKKYGKEIYKKKKAQKLNFLILSLF